MLVGEEGEAKAQRTGALFIETSAKTGTGIQNLFHKVLSIFKLLAYFPQKKYFLCVLPLEWQNNGNAMMK